MSFISRQAVRWIPLFVLALLVNFAAGPVCLAKEAAADQKTETKPAKVRYAHLVLSGEMPEGPQGAGPFAELLPGLAKTVARLDRAAKDKSIEGVVLDLQGLQIGRGTAGELQAAIQRVRQAGKPVIAQLETASPREYLLACACDEIVMPESGMLILPGVRAEGLFMRGLLNKLGVEPDIIHMGDSKGAGESYTRKKWSKPVKANLTALVDDLYTQMVEAIGLARPVTETQARELIDQGVLTARQALDVKLVDRLAYPDQVRQSLADQHKEQRLVYVMDYGAKQIDTDFSGPTGFFKLLGMMAGSESGKGSRGKKVAVVYGVGPIMTGESEQELLGGSSTIGSTTLCQALDEANRDDSVAAIVLRVNSPGGSALASDLIWRKTQEIQKPIVASMGDVAASGGYYISMGCDKIIAESHTVTGSIGVVSGKMALRGLYDKLGISIDTISRGASSGIFSSTNPFTKRERDAITSMMQDVYQQFTTKAAAGRDMPHEQLLELASGKVYTGRQAKQLGLVDDLGTLRDAIATAKQLAGIPAEEKVRLKTLPHQKDFFEELFGGGRKPREVRLNINGVSIPQELQQALNRLQTWRQVLDKECVGLMMPIDVVVE